MIATTLTLLLAETCVGREENRRIVIQNGVLQCISSLFDFLLQQAGDTGAGDDSVALHNFQLNKTLQSLCAAVCRLIRSLTRDDDFSEDFGDAHENAKKLVLKADALLSLVRLTKIC